MFTIKHEQRKTGITSVTACVSYDKLPVDDLGRKITQLIVRGSEGTSKLLLDFGDVVYVENVKGKTIDVIKAPKA